MQALAYKRHWQGASIVLLVLVLAAALMPAIWFWDDKPSGISWLKGADKWMHGITFTVLSVWFAGLYRRESYVWIAVWLLLFGLLIEACQRMVGYRMAEWLDVGADIGGIMVGLALATIGLGKWCLKFEQWLNDKRA